MLLVDVFQYLKSRISAKEVVLRNKVDSGYHHANRLLVPTVAIIIPTRDRAELLISCVESIFSKTTYSNFEIIVIDNDSREQRTLDYLSELSNRSVTVVRKPIKFNFSELCNFGASISSAEYLCFMNNDIEVIEPRWLDFLMDHAVQEGSGVIGSKLLYKSGDIQHLGLAFGLGGLAGHPYKGVNPRAITEISNNCFYVSGVTFACALVSAKKFGLLSGLDPRFKVGLNDVDFCMRSADQGFENILCSKSSLFHFESQSRAPMSSARGAFRATKEVFRFLKLYGFPSERFFAAHQGSDSD